MVNIKRGCLCVLSYLWWGNNQFLFVNKNIIYENFVCLKTSIFLQDLFIQLWCLNRHLIAVTFFFSQTNYVKKVWISSHSFWWWSVQETEGIRYCNFCYLIIIYLITLIEDNFVFQLVTIFIIEYQWFCNNNIWMIDLSIFLE